MMGTGVTVMNRPDHDYADMAFAIKCMETGAARTLRVEAGLTKTELARRVDVHSAYIKRWEDGDNRPVLRNLNVLAAYGRELRRLAQQEDD